MTIGVIVQKYFCNNLGVYALSYCAIDRVIKYCKSKNDTIEVRVFSDNPDKVLDEIKNVFNYENVKTFPIIEVRNPMSYIKYSHNISSCDIVLDTGLGDGFSDIYSNGKFLLQFLLKIIPEYRGCATILLPQTIGPYKNPLFERMAGRVIKNSTVCFTRDEISNVYAKSISCNKAVIQTTDMAMKLPKSNKEYIIPKGVNIGLNVSGLLYMGGYTKSNQFNLLFDYSLFINLLVEKLLNKDFNVHLISHVYRNNGEGDEYAINTLAEKYKKLIIAPLFDSPMDAKAYISKMDFFIGSRMHSTIAAISTYVPVCPIGYSRKFNGLFNTIGYEDFVDATNDTMEDSLVKIIKFIDKREDIKRDVDAAIERVEELYDVFYDIIENVFNEYYTSGSKYEK